MASSTSSPPPPTPPNKIVVVGGGVIGVCTAYFLSQKSQTSVTLIEKSSVACAASGKAGGFLALDWCDSTPALSSLARSSFNLHRSLSDSLNGPQSYGYRPLTTLSVPLPLPKAQHSSSPLLPSWVDGPAGPPKTIGTTNTTAQVHPQLFTRTLLNAAVKDHGVEVMIGEVAKVEVDAGKVTGVRVRGRGEAAEERVVEGDAVVLAMGPWSGRMDILKEVFKVTGLKTHSVVVRPRDVEAITPHALYLSYQDAPGEKLREPEVYPRPSGSYVIN